MGLTALILRCPTSQKPETGKEFVPTIFKVQLSPELLLEGRAVTDAATLKIVLWLLWRVTFLSAPLAALEDGTWNPNVGGRLQS